VPDRTTLALGAAVGCGALGFAGQLVGAILLDVTVPAAVRGLAPATAAGAVLTFLAIAISGRPARDRALAA
jgi:hypothetical protein